MPLFFLQLIVTRALKKSYRFLLSVMVINWIAKNLVMYHISPRVVLYFFVWLGGGAIYAEGNKMIFISKYLSKEQENVGYAYYGYLTCVSSVRQLHCDIVYWTRKSTWRWTLVTNGKHVYQNRFYWMLFAMAWNRTQKIYFIPLSLK